LQDAQCLKSNPLPLHQDQSYAKKHPKPLVYIIFCQKSIATGSLEQGHHIFLKALAGNNFSSESIRAYSADITQFLEFLKSVRVDWNNPKKIQRLDIVEFMNRLSGLRRTGTTRARKLASLRHFLKFLKENGVIAGNPAETITRARKEEKDPAVLFKNEYKALLFEAQGNSRDYAILLTFLKSGIRESELATLSLEDVDFVHDELTVREGKGKKERKIPLMPELKTAIQRYLGERDDQQEKIVDVETLFLARNGTSLNASSIRKLVKKYYAKAGVRKSGVHTLRHTFSAHNVNNGMSIADLQKILGHKKKETTLKYIHVVNTSLRETMLKTQA
jgi:site-specific recombinase XerD